MATKKKLAVEDGGADAPETPQDAPVAASAPPVASVAEGAVKTLSDAILAAIARAVARLPEDLRANAFIIETVLTQEFDKVSFTAWRAQAFAEVIAALQSGKSEVRHDPTELA